MPFLLVSFDAMTSLMTKHQNFPEALSSLLQELRFSMNFAHQDTRSGLLSLEQPLHKLLLFSLVPSIGFSINGLLQMLVPSNAVNGLFYVSKLIHTNTQPCFPVKQGWAANATPGIYLWHLPVFTGLENTPQVANTGKYWQIEIFGLKILQKS